ncbi:MULTISPECIES: twin-arginine translocase TatA/TatE family subunit [Pseudomonas]|uniref:Sec-independent protein translocase protein TatA n=1 Tax=Pseudomonas sessilinigenes TaxID=658629 RepID=A0ABX8MQR2_9PSED|nr:MULTISPECIES: twin-arginine translocase TatA/TatE family subunit [Pseudomonas]AZC22130.1 Twin-arginine translocation protein TatA [Pseudomonas sessilinigenes]QIH05752.1 twin-arginine translocase TatA/TatE family subunit [Pseudomonas sp. BIOMIG1BAC]QXH41222.1 twin-arginine translocase TatA/TatE family subunit [Pseudomonas sessilinigenes]UMZ12540.1 twin-arginine translocase TatA/TatE family subunit [Pseudomonas sp. MPFS]
MGIFDWKHWIVILVVVVLVFGTKKLKNLGTDVGESIKGFRKAMNDDEKPAEPVVPPAPQAAQPAQPQQGAPLNQPHTIDVQAQKVEEPTRKDS